MESSEISLLDAFVSVVERLQRLWPTFTLLIVTADIMFIVGRFWYFGYQTLGVFTISDYWVSGWMFLPVLLALLIYPFAQLSFARATVLPPVATTASPASRAPTGRIAHVAIATLFVGAALLWAMCLLWNDPKYAFENVVAGFLCLVAMLFICTLVHPRPFGALIICCLAISVSIPFFFGKVIGSSAFDDRPGNTIKFEDGSAICARVVQFAERGVFAVVHKEPHFFKWDDIRSVSRVPISDRLRIDRSGIWLVDLPTCDVAATKAATP